MHWILPLYFVLSIAWGLELCVPFLDQYLLTTD